MDGALQDWLNQTMAPQSAYQHIKAGAWRIAQGWICERRWRYPLRRVFKAEDALHRFSVDVVDMQDVGPHHAHPWAKST